MVIIPARCTFNGLWRLDGVRDLVNFGLPMLRQVAANKDIVSKRGCEKHLNPGAKLTVLTVRIVHSNVRVTIDLPDSAHWAVRIIVDGGKETPVRALAFLTLADDP